MHDFNIRLLTISKEIGFTPLLLNKYNWEFYLANSRAFSHWQLAFGQNWLLANSQ